MTRLAIVPSVERRTRSVTSVFNSTFDGTLSHLLRAVGNVAAARIRLRPFPATTADVDRIRNRERRLFELVDGVLVEKVMGALESMLAMEIGINIGIYLKKRNLGVVLGADGMLRVLPDQVRIPDVCFIRWERIGEKVFPTTPIPRLAPDLAVEVLSPGNTAGEMTRKLHDYFSGGVSDVWLVNPATRSAKVYSSPNDFRELDESESLRAENLLPGFELPLAELFQNMAKSRTKRKKKR
jgi:Uma2 family endonuclease